MSERVIVLVEDNRTDEELALRALKKTNIVNPIIVLRDGAEALDYMFRRGKHANVPTEQIVQVVLLDLKLPKLDGLEVLAALRADDRTKLVPVVVLTSSDEESDLVRSYGLGANSYVRKPVDFVHFAEAVRQLGLYWMLINQPPPG
jgi:two-component system response regulator